MGRMSAGSDDDEAGDSDNSCVRRVMGVGVPDSQRNFFFLTVIMNRTYGVQHTLATYSPMSS